MSTSSISTTEAPCQLVERDRIYVEPDRKFNTSNAHGRHTSWAGHKSTSDGDILTLDSPRGNPDNSTDKHVRSLSGHLFGMNLSPDNSVTYSPEQGDSKFDASQEHKNGVDLKVISCSSGEPTYPTQQPTSENVGRKHRRGLSEGKTHPSMAHRRINSGGNAAFINRHGEYDPSSTNAHLGPRRNHHVHPAQQPRDRHYSPQEHHRLNQWENYERRSAAHDPGLGPGPGYKYDYEPSPPIDDRDHYVDHGPHPPLYNRRTSPIPAPAPHHHHSSPYDGAPQHRNEGYQPRAPRRASPHHYQQHRTDRYSPSGSVDQGYSDHYYSPDPHHSHYPDEVGSNSSGERRSIHDNHQYHPRNEHYAANHGYYPPPRGSRNAHPPYPVQHQNPPRSLDKRYTQQHPVAGPPQHPLSDYGPIAHKPDPYYRRTSTSTVDSDGRIETDEKLFSGRDVYCNPNQPLQSSSPRVSPHLFDAALNGNMMPPRETTSPLEFLHHGDMCLGEDRRAISNNNTSQHAPFASTNKKERSPPPAFEKSQAPFASTHNRARSSSSDPQMKQFISAVEKSQTHKRGDSTDSFILDDNLFGENIVEPSIQSLPSTELPIDEFVPIPVSSVPHMSYNAYNTHVYPDQAKSASPHAEPSPLQQPYAEDQNNGNMPSGSTAKRTRRKCSIGGCANRVVQGGLCIAHGAKRKTCGHSGCTKHVKKAGMCSAHGPPRKLCEFEGCPKVAVQGGRCIAHGARKKLCSIIGCKKQSILGGMCKKHHDQHQDNEFHICPVASDGSEKNGTGNQGLPIDDLNTISDTSEHNKQRPKHARGLSIFTDKEFAEKIVNKEINL